MRSQRVVQTLIAARLGLTPSTVSRALRGVGRISSPTRRRIVLAAAEVGYRLPLHAAEAQIRRRLLAVAPADRGIPPPWGTWPRVQAALARLADRGHVVEVVRLDGADFARLAAGEDLRAEGVLLLQRQDAAAVARLAARVPVASLIHSYPGVLVDVVAPDNTAAGRLLAEALLAGGHRRIGWIGIDGGQDWHRLRLGGFLAALAAAGALPRSADLVSEPDAHPLAMGRAAKRARRRAAAGVRAWGAANDCAAQALLGIAPGLALAGVDALPARPGIPAFPSVRMPMEACAEEAVALLSWRIAHPGAPRRSLLLPPLLVSRA